MTPLTAEETIRRFYDLFMGNPRAYGTEQGGCVHVSETTENLQEYWWSLIELHLTGAKPIGIYPLVNIFEGMPEQHVDWCVRWGCVDFDIKAPGKSRYDFPDEEAAHLAASNLRNALEVCEVPAYIERTRSGGRHVWVFVENWVDAWVMRRALLVASAIAGTPTTEVNPKQEWLEEGQVGNYVRAPYPGSRVRQTMIRWADEEVILLDTFLRKVEYAKYDVLRSLADSLPQQEPAKTYTTRVVPELDRTITKKLSGLAFTMLEKGPLPGLCPTSQMDRSGWLYRLACECQESKLIPEEAVAVVTAADERWTQKYTDRLDGEKRLAATVRSAYTRSLTT